MRNWTVAARRGVTAKFSTVVSLLTIAGAVQAASGEPRQVPSQERFNCAIGVAFAVLTHFGKEVDLPSLQRRFPEAYQTTDAVVPMDVLADVLTSHGVVARPVRIESKALAQHHVPCILLISPQLSDDPEAKHYVYATDIQESENITLVDPNYLLGAVPVTEDDLQRMWDGYAILLPSDRPRIHDYLLAAATSTLALACCVDLVRQKRRRTDNSETGE